MSEAVVCDAGSGYVKCGLAGDTLPRVVFPSAVANTAKIDAKDNQHALVGDAAVIDRHALGVQYPVSHGVVQDWDAMVSLWDYTFYEQLKVLPDSSRVLLTEPALNSSHSRQRTLEIMFERYGFESALVHLGAALALYARGLFTGLALDIGDGVSHTVPMLDGVPWMHACKRVNIAGAQVTSYLADLLLKRGHSIRHAADLVDVDIMKQNLCYVSCNYQQDTKLARETTALVKPYTLPDGSVILVGPERFMATEVLFNPTLGGVECNGVADIAFQTIQAMDIDTRMDMYENILISGGSTALPGLATRLEKELCHMYETHVLKPPSIQVLAGVTYRGCWFQTAWMPLATWGACVCAKVGIPGRIKVFPEDMPFGSIPDRLLDMPGYWLWMQE